MKPENCEFASLIAMYNNVYECPMVYRTFTKLCGDKDCPDDCPLVKQQKEIDGLGESMGRVSHRCLDLRIENGILKQKVERLEKKISAMCDAIKVLLEGLDASEIKSYHNGKI